jgi:hypothetical protein
MKTPIQIGYVLSTVSAALALLLLAGCLEKHVIWSPDGSRAAVIAKEGLHLCDPDGNLGPLLMPGVYAAAWLGDSKGLVIARHEAKSKGADINELMTVRLVGDQVQAGAVIHSGLEMIEDLRLSPADKAVAFTTDIAPGDDEDFALLVARIGAAGAVEVAEHTAAYPDWANDGRSLVYSQVSGGGSKDELRLATLMRREVLDAGGQISLGKDIRQLAGLLFQKTARVRCLRDGRILFNALEVAFPVAAKDFPDEHEKLFALDPARQATLVRMIPGGELDKMPKGLAFFEVSPDERQLLFGGVDGEVCVLTLATGDVQVFQDAGKYGLLGAPVWRNAGGITYARRNPSVDGKIPSRRAEIVLRSTIQGSGNQEKVMSQAWSTEMLESVYSPTDKQ